jgi:FkbM family methyltransferase
MSNWIPPLSIKERLKKFVIPANINLYFLARREKIHGEREFRMLPLICPRDRVALDIGANMGIWTYEMQKYASFVHAFEPNPKLFAMLKPGIRGKNVSLHPIALSDRTGDSQLMVPKGRRGYSNYSATLSHETIRGTTYRTTQVSAYRLDDLKISSIGFMKIDVEGHEMEVIRGARETILSSRPNMIIEMEERHTKCPIEDNIREIEDLGYEAFCLVDGLLERVKNVDLDVHHRSPAHRKDYIFNWIFMPR